MGYFNAIPTLGSVRERLGYFACKTEEGELNTTLNNAYKLIANLEDKNRKWLVMAERLYDIMLAHETVSDDDWNQGIADCHKLMMGKEDE